MAEKLTKLTHKITIQPPTGRELYDLQFLLHAASPEAFGYTLVYCYIASAVNTLSLNTARNQLDLCIFLV